MARSEGDEEKMKESDIPSFCPFCKNISGVEWDEFYIEDITRSLYCGGETKTVDSAYVRVFCTRCEEEIRKEDVGGM